MAAAAAQKVVLRCHDAKDTLSLDMSECQLMHVPVAIYMLLMETPLNACNFSHNDLKKLPGKLCLKFPDLKELRAVSNKLTTLPPEIGELSSLQRIDVSSNAVSSLPESIYSLPFLEELILDNNQITDIDVERLQQMTSLKKLSLHGNPLNEEGRSRLQQCARFTVNL